MTNTALGAKKKEVTRTIIFKDKELTGTSVDSGPWCPAYL